MKELFERLGILEISPGASTGTVSFATGSDLLEVRSPIDGSLLASVRKAQEEDYERVMKAAVSAFRHWRQVPAPRRGEIVRRIGLRVRERLEDLGELICLETGKIRAEAQGEVQEMLDVCDFAVGQSRMLYGMTTQSERPGHRLFEQWHPLGPVGLITAFNFPVAVPAWNAMLALVCGDTLVWKPSGKTPLCALALTRIIGEVLRENGRPEGIFNLLIGDRQEIGERLTADARLPLISATGSVAMGRRVAEAVARRLGRTLLELGGNNALILTPAADPALAVRAILFGAVGTAGQRCTSTRRVIVHESLFDELAGRLIDAYRQVRIGDPRQKSTLMGPLVSREARQRVLEAIEELRRQGGRVLYGGEPLAGGLFDLGAYMRPCIAEAREEMELIRRETFGPLLYLLPYRELEEAIAIHNAVPQGLSSGIFTSDLREAELFLSAAGSDCGIAGVNIGTSGAEIGGAFGGEKDTGGGRESGSDAGKNYMRRQTNCINFSGELPLAQGIRFGD